MRLRDGDLFVQVVNIVLAALLIRQLIVFFQVVPDSLYDFNIFRNAGSAVLHGQSPFSVDGYIYPATAAVAFVPFATISLTLGGSIFALLTVFAVVAMLWILDIRDWRCFALALVSMPGWTSVTTGTLSGVCALLAAIIYRYRDHRWRAASALTVGLATKVFLWPLGVWLVATRRARTAALAIALTLVFVLLSWFTVGTSNFTAYHDSMSQAKQLAEASYSAFALLYALGLSPGAATFLVAVVGLAFLAVSWYTRNEALSFSLAVFAALVLSPVLWIHYLVLLYVPIAIARPRLSLLWFVPLLFVQRMLPPHADGSVVRIVLVLALVAITFFFVARACRETSADREIEASAGWPWIEPHVRPASDS